MADRYTCKTHKSTTYWLSEKDSYWGHLLPPNIECDTVNQRKEWEGGTYINYRVPKLSWLPLRRSQKMKTTSSDRISANLLRCSNGRLGSNFVHHIYGSKGHIIDARDECQVEGGEWGLAVKRGESAKRTNVTEKPKAICKSSPRYP